MSQTVPGGGATSRRRLWESGYEAPSRWAIFCNFLEKMAYMPFRSHFARFQSHLKEKNFLRFESQLNKSLPLLQVKSKTRLKSCILWFHFVTWPGQGSHGTLVSATFLALNHSLKDLPLKIFVLS